MGSLLHLRNIVIAFWIGCCCAGQAFAETPNASESRTAPHGLLAARCLECHSGTHPEGGLDLSHRQGLERGADSGPVLDNSAPESSVLWKVIESGSMPPKTKLLPEEKAEMFAWLREGAVLPEEPIDRLGISSSYRAGWDWWAFRPLMENTTTRVASLEGTATHGIVDALIEATLSERKVTPNPLATRRTWLRRVYLDLIGLPPTWDEVQAFEGDESLDAYENVVDALLASPEYGERWGRHWLDIARFGESDGFERNFPRANSWPYRDWVIRSLNEDMPYDEFVRMQIAGDVLQAGEEGLASVGFLVCGVHNTVVGESERMKRIAKQDELEEKIGTLSQAFLGLTAQCARCHEHKYDPISSQSYYQMASALQGVHHGDRESKPGGTKFYTVVSAEPGPTYVLVRGDVFQEGDRVHAGGIVGLGERAADFGLSDQAPDGQRRLELARWITDANRPLFSRVIANRLWHYHFGAGIVDTPNDFGFNGGRPSHPELLDYLAQRLLASGMRLKPLHREIVLSTTYRRASSPNPQNQQIDPGNRLLWRYPLRRLDGESVRDSMLQISQSLQRKLGGPGYQDVDVQELNGTTYYVPKPTEPSDCFRRTVYRFSPRCERRALLDALDCPDPSATAPRRSSTTTPLQALSLLNSEFVFQMSDAIAERVRYELHSAPAHGSKDAPSSREIVRALFREVLLRDPTLDEETQACNVVEAFGPQALARALWNANEFLIVE